MKFIDTLDQYSLSHDLVCKMRFDSYNPQKLDRVGIFQLGWHSIKDCIVYKWIPTGMFNKEIQIIFEKDILPKNKDRLYQFCYLRGESELCEASLPFTFNAEAVDNISESCLKPFSEDNINNVSLATATSSCFEPEQIVKLREENELLRACLKALVFDRHHNGKKPDYVAQIAEIKELVNNMKATFIQHQEVALLKQKFSELQKENKELYLEVMKLKKRIERLENKDNVVDSGLVINKLDETIKKTDSREAVELLSKSTTNMDFNIDNLKSIPPFPF